MSKLTINDVRPEVRAFAVAMEERLREHDTEKPWRDCSVEHLHDQLRERRLALWLATFFGRGNVLGEAADVAVHALMIADVCTELWPDEVE